MTELKVVQPLNAPEVPAEVIATEIKAIADAMRKLNDSRLTHKAIVTLVHETSKVSKRNIESVLSALGSLEADWLKPKAKHDADPRTVL